MVAALARLITSNRKHTTIRYTPHAVEFPCQAILPFFIVKNGERHNKAQPNGLLRIGRVQYKKVRDLNNRDATSDGFSRHELLAAMQGFYGPLNPSDYVSIYHFVLWEAGQAGVAVRGCERPDSPQSTLEFLRH
jgi:hypothetical protein